MSQRVKGEIAVNRESGRPSITSSQEAAGHPAGGVTRRAALTRAAAVGAGVLGSSLLAACGSSGSKATPSKVTSLNVICWEGYTDPSFTKPFERRTGITINSTYIGSNDELIAKLRGSPGVYDMVTPSCDTTQLLIQAGQAQPIDLAKVPNGQSTFEFFRKAPNVNVGGKLYGIPMAWGFIPLIYNADLVKTPPTSWRALWDPAHRNQISVWQDISLLYSAGLLLGVKDLFNMSDPQLEQVKAKLLQQKPLIRKYWTTAADLTNLFASKEVVLGMSFGGLTARQLRAQGINATEIIPKEGATSWFDNWMVTSSTSKLPACLAWLNHIQDPNTQAQIAKATGYGITNQRAMSLVPKDYADAYHLQDPSFIARLNYWKRVPRRQQYLDILNAVVAS